MSGEGERWLPLADYEGRYEVSDLGRVRSLLHKTPNSRGDGYRSIKGQLLKPVPQRAGYLVVALHKGGKQRTRLIAHLVAETFIGPRPDGMFVCHNNGIKTDNRASNLRYDTPAANSADAVRHGANREARKTHCKWGHPFSAENTAISTRGARICKACRRTWNHSRNRRRPAYFIIEEFQNDPTLAYRCLP